MRSVVLKITEWNSAKAWTSDIAHTKNMLVDQLRKSTPMSHTEAKRLIRAVFCHESSELLLVNAEFYNAIRNALQSVGAQVEVHPAQLGVQADAVDGAA
jgi:hypothetical protein